MDVGQPPPPFLSRNEEYQPQPVLDDQEDSQPHRVSQMAFPQMYYPQPTPPKDLLSSVQWHWILLGIIIGALLMNMRPVVIKSAP